MDRKKVMLVDSSRLFREGLKGLLKSSKLEAVREAPNLEEALTVASLGPVDLVVLDFQESSDREVELLKALRHALPTSCFVILTSDVSTLKLAQALSSGVDGYLLKSMSMDALIQSLDLVLLGEKVFPTTLARLLVDGKLDIGCHEHDASLNGLSEREVQILRCLANGDPNKVIASRLRITEATVKVHIKGVLKKIPATNRTQAAIWAIENGIERYGLRTTEH